MFESSFSKPPLVAALAIAAALSAKSVAASGEYPRVFRTFMPEAGPSAFAVELSPELAICYDPLRGGVSQLWRGHIDLEPTFQAKINQPAKIIGDIFYREAQRYPLRLADPEAEAHHRFKGYRYDRKSVTFEYTLRGLPVSETLRLTEDGAGLIREIALPAGGGAGFFTLEEQAGAQVSVRGGTEIRPGLWRFQEGTRFTMSITPKTQQAR